MRKINHRKVNKGKNVFISQNVIVGHPHNVFIGDNTYINGGMLFAGENSRIEIGSNCLISHAVHIRTTTHKFKNRNVLILKQGSEEKDIIIGDDVWIGYGAQILSGVKIGNSAVIGAGAVVTKNVEEYMVMGGVPAKVIGKRE